MSNFLENGYLVLQNNQTGLQKQFDELQNDILQVLKELLKTDGGFKDLYQKASVLYHPFDLQNFLFSQISLKKIERILLNAELLDVLKELQGPDLMYIQDGFFNITSSDIKEAIINKRPHQEIWSGAGLCETRLWAHISDGKGLEVVEGSHLYGLIPNQDREPLPDQPTIFNFKELKTSPGDIVLFHPLLLHRTAVDQGSDFRIAYTTGIKSSQRPLEGLQQHFNWKIFHLSDTAQIQKRLGNPYLSPYRVLKESFNHRSPNDGYLNLNEI